MPVTIIYTEAPCCAHCGRPMHEWAVFADVHYHDACRQERIQAALDAAFARVRELVVQQRPCPVEVSKVIDESFWDLC